MNNPRLPRLCWLASVIAIALASSAFAESSADVDRPDEISFTDDDRWNFQLFGTLLVDVSNRDVIMGGPTLGIGYYVLDTLAFNFEATGYAIDQDTDNATGWGISLGLRHHILELGKASLFVDVSGGIFEADDPVPANGTSFNYMFQSGPGIAYSLEEDVYLITGLRFFHLSNANRNNDDSNPSLNGPQVFVGVMYTF